MGGELRLSRIIWKIIASGSSVGGGGSLFEGKIPLWENGSSLPLWENETGVSLSCLYGEDAILPSRRPAQASCLADSSAVVWCYRVDSFWLSSHLYICLMAQNGRMARIYRHHLEAADVARHTNDAMGTPVIALFIKQTRQSACFGHDLLRQFAVYSFSECPMFSSIYAFSNLARWLH